MNHTLKNIQLFLTAALLSGCSASSAVNYSSSSSFSDEMNSVHESEQLISDISALISAKALTDFSNISASYNSFTSIVPVGDGDALLKLGSAVQYCNPEVSESFDYYCSDPECTHSNTNCHCYIGNADYFLSNHGIWYYSKPSEAGGFELICHNPDTNLRTVIAAYPSNKCINGFFLSHETLYITVEDTEIQETDDSYQFIDCIDLKTLSSHILFQDKGHQIFLGSNGSKAVIQHTELHESTHGNINPYYELRIYDLVTGDYSVILDSDYGYSPINDNCQKISGNLFVYPHNNQIHLLDLDSMEDTVIYTSDTTVSYTWFFGERIRFIEKSEETGNTIEVMIDPDGHNRIEYPQIIDSDTEKRIFGYSYLTEHGQIGSYVSEGESVIKDGWLSEENYLNCCLSQIVS